MAAGARGERVNRWRVLLAPVRVRVTAAATLVALVGAVIGALVFLAQLRSGIEHELLSSGAQQADAMVAQLGAGASPRDVVASGKNDIVLQHEVLLDPPSHMGHGKRFGPEPTVVESEVMATLLADIMDKNPDQKMQLANARASFSVSGKH